MLKPSLRFRGWRRALTPKNAVVYLYTTRSVPYNWFNSESFRFGQDYDWEDFQASLILDYSTNHGSPTLTLNHQERIDNGK